MKRGVVTLLSASGCLMFGVGSIAVTAENPYQSIIERNAFGLKDPPPKVDPAAEAAKQPPPNVFLTGITTVFGNKRALLKIVPPAAPVKPGEKPLEPETFMMTEGQRNGDLEVLIINEVKGVVTIRLAGKEMPIDFENNGVKIASAPSPLPGAPGTMPGALPAFPLRPGGTPPTGTPPPVAQPLGASYSPSPAFARPMRLTDGTLGATGGSTTYSGRSLPAVSTPGGTLSFRGSPSAAPPPSAPDPREGLSPEQVHAITIANQMKAIQEGDSRANLFPPLPDGFGNQNQTAPQVQQLPNFPPPTIPGQPRR